MAIFTVKDIFDFAVKIEENGLYFYRESAKNMANPKIQRLFNELADEEVKHKQTFLDLAQRLGNLKPAEIHQEEYYDYLEAYTQNLIFSEADIKSRIAKIDDEEVAIVYAIDKELDTVHYYKDIKAVVPSAEHGLIDKIIAEERRHVLRLAEYRKTLQ